jgi:malate synthase
MESNIALDQSLTVNNSKDVARIDEILTKEALDFIFKLENQFSHRRKDLLNQRKVRQLSIDNGNLPDFLNSTESIRTSDWKVSPIPKDLEDRRVEITGPVDRKMIINALNSGVKVFMADFEDSNSPTWSNIINGQLNLLDANNKTISYTNPKNQKFYSLNDKIATLMVRPRGWHLEEKNVLLDGKSISASIFDFGLYFFHNAHQLINSGTGPYFYLPKLESHLEARLWNDIFVESQNLLNIPIGTIKATVLIETILAAFEMEEILYELKDHSAGLNCGRWDYIFSFIKKFKNHSDYVLPNRSQVTMKRHFLNSYVKQLVYVCHKRGAHAMGGMAAQIPIKNDLDANERAMLLVKNDKQREANAGHDGTWIAHPGLVPIALDAFNSVMPEANQINKMIDNPNITQQDLLKVPDGQITELGLRDNIKVGLQYVEAWLLGNGCVPLYNLMEDAATAEISRSQLWQWLKHESELDDGRKINKDLIVKIFDEELNNIKNEIGQDRFDSGKFNLAMNLFKEMILKEEFDEFLTLPAYNHI